MSINLQERGSCHIEVVDGKRVLVNGSDIFSHLGNALSSTDNMEHLKPVFESIGIDNFSVSEDGIAGIGGVILNRIWSKFRCYMESMKKIKLIITSQKKPSYVILGEDFEEKIMQICESKGITVNVRKFNSNMDLKTMSFRIDSVNGNIINIHKILQVDGNSHVLFISHRSFKMIKDLL